MVGEVELESTRLLSIEFESIGYTISPTRRNKAYLYPNCNPNSFILLRLLPFTLLPK